MVVSGYVCYYAGKIGGEICRRSVSGFAENLLGAVVFELRVWW
jgi:hypothetical protein